MKTDAGLVEEIRDVSRAIVREWGFMGGDFAGTDLSPSAVHALIEVEHGRATASELATRLRLEKSSVSRMLRKLVEAGDVREEPSDDDGRVKVLALTGSGKQRVMAIHAFASAQVSDALSRLRPREARTVLEGLRLYTGALANRTGPQDAAPDVTVTSGYCTGLIARITEMHALSFGRESGFGQRFESVVAGGLAEFCNRLENPRNAIWAARRGHEIIGSVAIDGEDMGENAAHLRWFIVGDGVRGRGIGRRLLSAALAFADGQGFAETQLWTFGGHSAARHLYEAHGFACVEERPASQWGDGVLEQRYVRPRP